MARSRFDREDPEVALRPADGDPLGALGEAARLSRSPDHETSVAAGQRVRAVAGALRRRVLEILAERPMTDIELESLDEFRPRYAYSTVRKRRSELYNAGLVQWTGVVRGGAKEWRAT